LYRIICFTYKSVSTNGVAIAPTAADILEDSNVTAYPGNTSIFSYYRLETSKNYKILYDKFHILDVNSYGTKMVNVRIPKSKLPKMIQYLSTQSSANSVGDNAIYIQVIGDSGVTSVFTIYGSLLYKDL